MQRSDGRFPVQLRPFSITSKVIPYCFSSVAVEVCGTRVVCCIRGPQQLTSEFRPHKGKVSCTVHFAPFVAGGAVENKNNSSASKKYAAGVEKELALILEGITEQWVLLETLPQLQLEALFEVLSVDGCVLSALVSALNAALILGGLDVVDIVASSTVASMMSKGEGDAMVLVCDPTLGELVAATSHCTVVACTSTGQILYVNCDGPTTVEVCSGLVNAAVECCRYQREVVVSQLNLE